jgi:hypothetical protein
VTAGGSTIRSQGAGALRVMEIGGHGLWIANQVCDLVQLRSFADGCAVRIHMRLP